MLGAECMYKYTHVQITQHIHYIYNTYIIHIYICVCVCVYIYAHVRTAEHAVEGGVGVGEGRFLV
jgi:hypothetical protein